MRKNFVRGLLFALALLLSAGAAAAQTRLPDGTLAVPPLARVTDSTGTLSGSQRQALEARLAAFESAHGSQIAVVIVSSTQPEPISDFAQRIGDAWKIGRANVGDGLLIVVAKDDRRVWIAVAKTLEGAVPDLAAKRIIREEIVPRFGQGDFAGGISAGLERIFRLIEGEALPTPSGIPASHVAAGEDIFNVLLPIIAVGAAVASIFRRVLGGVGVLVAGVGAGVLAGIFFSSLILGVVAAVLVLFFGLAIGGHRSGRVLGGRRGGVFVPGGFGGGHSGGFGRGGGWSSGGGGNFGGGGAGGSW